MLDYDREAEIYDRSRGGEERAAAAADTIGHLLPSRARSILDVACGTGIVTARLKQPGRRVVALDLSAGMLTKATGRLPGSVVRADAAALPVASGRLDAVVMIWLLHLVPEPEQLVAEAARVLGPAGRLITTVDKDCGAFAVMSEA